MGSHVTRASNFNVPQEMVRTCVRAERNDRWKPKFRNVPRYLLSGYRPCPPACACNLANKLCLGREVLKFEAEDSKALRPIFHKRGQEMTRVDLSLHPSKPFHDLKMPRDSTQPLPHLGAKCDFVAHDIADSVPKWRFSAFSE